MLKTSLEIKNQKENKFINMIINLLNYLFDDKMAIIVFISIVFETVLFVGIIKNSGASVYKFNINDILYGNTRIVILFSLAFISLSFIFTKRIHWFFLVITNTLYSILIIADLWYYRGFQDFLSIHTLGESQNLHNLGRAVFSMARTIDLIFVFDIIIVLILALLLRKKWNVVRRKKILFLIVLCYPVFMLTTLHYRYDFNDDNYTGRILFKTQYMPYATMENLTPIGYHFYDIVMYINDNRIIKLSKKNESLINQWLSYKNEDLPDNEYKGVFKGKNLIFIQVESLENFVIDQKYDGQVLTPNLNKLIKNSYYFPNFYEQVNNGNSGDADLMSNASVLPVRRGSTFFRFPKNNYNTLAQILGNNNYYTRSLHASDGAIWNISTALKSFGFDNSKDMYDFKNSNTFWMGLSDEEFFSQVSDLVNSDSKPFYYYTVTVTSHEPFELPDNMKTLKLNSSFDGTCMGKYFQAIHYTDKQIGNFINLLDKKGILDSSVIVIYGDHSGIHKYFNDQVNKLTQYKNWWDNNYKVPFIVYSKNMTGKKIDTIGGQIDILPSMLYLMGVDKSEYENTSMGRNLFNTQKNYVILNNGTIIGQNELSQEDISHIKQSFNIADLITRTDYFKNNK